YRSCTLDPPSAQFTRDLAIPIVTDGIIANPKAQYKDQATSTYYNTLISDTVNPAFQGKKWNADAGANAKTFADAFGQTGLKSLRELLDKFVTDCGNSRTDIAPVDVSGMTTMSFQNDEEKVGFIASHHGPCEVWIDDHKIWHEDDCRGKYTGFPAVMPVDYSVCKGKCTLKFYWLAVHEPKWQVYKQCVPISNPHGSIAMALLQGKRALVVGLMNKHSLAACITHSLLAHGARVVVSSKAPLSASQRSACGFVVPPLTSASCNFAACDVEDDASIHGLMAECRDVLGGRLDILVHSVAFAPRETFQNGLLGVSKHAWTEAMDVSAYSLVALTRAALPLMTQSDNSDASKSQPDRSILALSYAGANKVVPNYNMMGPAKAALEATTRQLAFELGPCGIRVNCLSPGPMNTVSARGIPGISKMRKYAEEHAPLGRNASHEDVGNWAAFLASDMARAITGQTVYVDGGISIMAPFAKDQAAP
ncbi:TPA: hypothetical protein N0F65_005837, partial [Lagenidium giganteum]